MIEHICVYIHVHTQISSFKICLPEGLLIYITILQLPNRKERFSTYSIYVLTSTTFVWEKQGREGQVAFGLGTLQYHKRLILSQY